MTSTERELGVIKENVVKKLEELGVTVVPV